MSSNMSMIPGTPDWIKSKGSKSNTTAPAGPDEPKVTVVEEGKSNPIEVKTDTNN
jgi:hypothetical protein